MSQKKPSQKVISVQPPSKKYWPLEILKNVTLSETFLLQNKKVQIYGNMQIHGKLKIFFFLLVCLFCFFFAKFVISASYLAVTFQFHEYQVHLFIFLSNMYLKQLASWPFRLDAKLI